MTSDEYVVMDRVLTQKAPLPLKDRIRRFAPAALFQIFAILKFSFLFFIIMDRPWTQIEGTILAVLLGMDAILLLSAVFRDACTLIISSVLSFLLLIANIVLLVFVPVFVTSFFASGASDQYIAAPRGWKMFDEVRDMFKTKEELHFFKGFEYGMSIEMLLLVAALVHALQFSLVSAVWDSKLSMKNENQQEKEKRNSVYLV